MAINRDWIYKQACRLSHDIHFIKFDKLFELITKIRFTNNSFEFVN